MRDVEVFILAGGLSSRLGRDKALVELGGEALAARAARIAGAGLPGSKVTIVAGRPGQFGTDVFLDDIPIICDEVTGQGPIGGIRTALDHGSAEWIFVLACDYPFITPEFISLLAEMAEDADAVVPEQPDGRLQPLCAFYRRRSAAAIAADLIGSPGKTPPTRELVRRLSTLTVGPEQYCGLPNFDAFFCNINSAADLAAAENFARKLSP